MLINKDSPLFARPLWFSAMGFLRFKNLLAVTMILQMAWTPTFVRFPRKPIGEPSLNFMKVVLFLSLQEAITNDV